jgi:hypothetical protein
MGRNILRRRNWKNYAGIGNGWRKLRMRLSIIGKKGTRVKNQLALNLNGSIQILTSRKLIQCSDSVFANKICTLWFKNQLITIRGSC